ncbi:hypothetical protein L596_021590 [Steinernema carpocapsae]|uniref:Uncharacterized protein n=1 Tax=Steinernema carpocapsae TaxID=34508 RepID=A0A4U5MJ82_STECR|nr:hypothetical protein L596_021590 [Steinernema carpocapsae]
MGSLRSLFLLIFCASACTAQIYHRLHRSPHSPPEAVDDDKKIISCGSYSIGDEVHFLTEKWSKESMTRAYIYDFKCDFEGIARICQNAFTRTSYGVEIPKTYVLNHTLPFYYVRENQNDTVAVTMQNYLCQPYVSAEALNVSAGSWSDKLVTVGVYQGKMMTEDEFLEIATEECGKKPSSHSLGGKCGTFTPSRYLEMEFVCDLPKNDSIFKIDHPIGLEDKAAFYHKPQFQILEMYASAAKELEMTMIKNDTKQIAKLTTTLNGYIYHARAMVRHAHEFAKIAEVSTNMQHVHETIYRSREKVFQRVKAWVEQTGVDRSIDLFLRAARLISNRSEAFSLENWHRKAEIGQYDVAKLSEENMPFSEALKYFPELKSSVEAYYLDFIKNHTLGFHREHLGFLNETGAHEKLLMFYEDIFSPGLIDQQYLDSGKGISLIWIYFLVTVVCLVGFVTLGFYFKANNSSKGPGRVIYKCGDGKDRPLLMENVDNPVFVGI